MEHHPSHVTILVVEDDQLVRELLQDTLTDEGYQVITAKSAEEALTTIATVLPNLMTLDLDLPGITGEVILKELRQRDDTLELPIVIVSAKHPIPQEIRKLAQATVPKPFDVDKFLTVIRNIIPPPEQAATAEQ